MNTWGFLRNIKSIYSDISSSAYDNNQEILSIKDFKKVFDERLDIYVKNRIDNIIDITDNDKIKSSLLYIKELTSSGKRVRPYNAYLAYKLSQGNGDIYDALVGIELFHVFALVHDDIIDGSDERHKKLTIHSYYKSLLDNDKKNNHVSNSQAILLGDLIFSWSSDALISNTSVANLNDVRAIFNKMIDEVVIGQMIDVDLMVRDETTKKELENKNLLKTARYTFVNPLKIGCALAGKAGRYDEFFEMWGTAMGYAYQVQDDILDITGNPQVTGKANFKDFEDGQHTFVTHYITENGNSYQKEKLKSFWKRELSSKDKKELLIFLESTEALNVGRKIVNDNIKQAEDSIIKYKLQEPYKTAFNNIVNLLKFRNE